MPDKFTPDARSGFNPAQLGEFLAGCETELIEFRRDLHMHPELGYAEHRTTRKLAQRLREAGLRPVILPCGTGLFCDIGPAGGTTVALRADIDALPLQDLKAVPYRSTVTGRAHACGHDVHTVMVLGAGLYLARLAKAGLLRGRVRLIFQPAEEKPGGALDVINAGGLDGVERIFALHCDPSLEVGKLGLVVGPITASFDKVMVKLTGPGGHTARPHQTVDMVQVLGGFATAVPAMLSREIDARSSAVLCWGLLESGSAINVIPKEGVVTGSLRCSNEEARRRAGELIKTRLPHLAAFYGVNASVDVERVLPPTVNDEKCIRFFRESATPLLGKGGVVPTEPSMGGEDFSHYVARIAGALARLGTRAPNCKKCDLHQGGFDVDERCIRHGAGVLAATALNALGG